MEATFVPLDDMSNPCVFQVRRGAQFALNFYLRRELPECPSAEIQARAASGTIQAFVSPSGLRELAEQRRPFRVVNSSCLNTFLVEIRIGSSAGAMQDGR